MDKPTKAGYYWFRGQFGNNKMSEPVEVLADDVGLQVFLIWTDDYFPLDDFSGEWFELTEEKICGSSN